MKSLEASSQILYLYDVPGKLWKRFFQDFIISLSTLLHGTETEKLNWWGRKAKVVYVPMIFSDVLSGRSVCMIWMGTEWSRKRNWQTYLLLCASWWASIWDHRWVGKFSTETWFAISLCKERSLIPPLLAVQIFTKKQVTDFLGGFWSSKLHESFWIW